MCADRTTPPHPRRQRPTYTPPPTAAFVVLLLSASLTLLLLHNPVSAASTAPPSAGRYISKTLPFRWESPPIYDPGAEPYGTATDTEINNLNPSKTPSTRSPGSAAAAQTAATFPGSLYDTPGHAIASGLFVGVAGTGILWVVLFVVRFYVVWIGMAVWGVVRGGMPQAR